MRNLTIGLVTILSAAVFGSASAETVGTSFDEKVRSYLLKNPEVILEALAVLTEREEKAQLIAKIASFPVLFEEEPVLGLGDPDAPIRVVEFFDYKCLPCKAVHGPLSALVEQTPELRIEMRQLPILTPGSEKATRFAYAVRDLAGDEAYRIAHDLLWAHRGPFNTGVFTRMSATLELDYEALDPLMWSEDVSATIDANRDMAIDLGLVGTPAFVTSKDIAVGTTDVAALTALFLGKQP